WEAGMVRNWGPFIWDECKVRDEYTVQFKWEAPYRVFLNSRLNLICKEWGTSLPDDSEDMGWYDPVGSGPYAVKQFVSEDVCVLEAREDYWNKDEVGPCYVKEWTVKFYKDASTMYMDLEVGNLDFAEVQATDFSRYMKAGGGGDGFDLFMITTGVTQYFTFSFDDFPAWNDRRLREAVAIGMDWDQLGRAAYDELFIPADSLMPKDAPTYIFPGKYEYNPERAKQLLAEAGYGPDNPMKIITTLMDSQLYKALGENTQFQLSQIGIELTLDYLDIMSAITVWNAPGGTDIGFWWNINGSAAFDMYDATPNACVDTGSTYLHVYDPKFVELWTIMRNSVDEAKVDQAVRELQQVNFDEIIYIPYYEFSGSFGYRTDKFTEAQLKKFITGINIYQIGRLGLLSAWQ
ncbi:MAG: ABC transporter substrate-binding protein, partial [Clostridiales bacterium]|nr:ABC transporter substrate-binding protein [Clostridiales bacterium]